MTFDRLSEGLALIAGVVGMAALVASWPRRGRRVDAARQRHPSADAPISVAVAEGDGAAHWVVSTRTGMPPVAIDIFTYQPTGTDEPWESEPIVDPVTVAPGEAVHLDSVVSQPGASYDVVVAWTLRHPTGDVQGSRTLTIAPTTDVQVAALPEHANSSRVLIPMWVAIAALLGVMTLVAGARVLDGRDAGFVAETVPVTAASTPASDPSAPIAVTTDAPSEPPVPSTATAARATTSPTASPASTPGVTDATRAPATTARPVARTTTVPPVAGPRVVILGRVEDCRYGADCVVAGFTLDGFAGSGEYICEFDDGSRFAFRYVGDGAENACARSGPSPSITIEVDGIRSATITREAPNGT